MGWYKLIDGLCQRYGCLPSALWQEDAALILQMVGTITADAEALASG